MIYIDRCVCFQKTFAELKQVAEETQSHTLKKLQGHETFGQKCKRCHPYVQRMLQTGEVAFYQVFSDLTPPN